MAEIIQPTARNIVETLLAELPRMGEVQIISSAPPVDANDRVYVEPFVVAIPASLTKHDLTADYHKAQQLLQPYRRTGTAKMLDLASIITWANRFKGVDSVLFADTTARPSLTCIADYHGEGAPVNHPIERDPSASHCTHRAVYTFPMSREWIFWTGISDKLLGKAEFGDFIEAHAKDLLDPTPAILQPQYQDDPAPWELAMIQIAEQLSGRFGQYQTLVQLARQFVVNETSNLSVTLNRDTGENSIQFLDEHRDADGAPIRIPNLFMILIPVFEGGAGYRLAVRFRYVKAGADIKFRMSLHNADLAFRDAIQLAVSAAADETGLPVLAGTPEA